LEYAFLHHLAGTHLISSHYHVHSGSKFGKIERFFCRCVSSTHNRYILTSEEESVANSASAHTEAIQSLFAFQSQPCCGSAGCNDYRICKNHLLLINPNLIGLRHEVNLGSKTETNIGAHSLCLLLEIDHHLRTLHAVGISRIILHLGRRSEER